MKYILYEINKKQEIRKKILEEVFSEDTYQFEEGWSLLLDYPMSKENTYHDLNNYADGQGLDGFLFPCGTFIHAPDKKREILISNYLESINRLFKYASLAGVDNEYYKQSQKEDGKIIRFLSNQSFSDEFATEHAYWRNFKEGTKEQLEWLKKHSSKMSKNQKSDIESYLSTLDYKEKEKLMKKEGNYKVKKAGLVINEYGNDINLRIEFSNLMINIPSYQLREAHVNRLLADIFDLDLGSGLYAQEITGKYCRIILKNGYPKVIRHITEDKEYSLDFLKLNQ